MDWPVIVAFEFIWKLFWAFIQCMLPYCIYWPPLLYWLYGTRYQVHYIWWYLLKSATKFRPGDRQTVDKTDWRRPDFRYGTWYPVQAKPTFSYLLFIHNFFLWVLSMTLIKVCSSVVSIYKDNKRICNYTTESNHEPFCFLCLWGAIIPHWFLKK